jgi:YegS/Rv2252/BmrU family lipid kinase
VRRVLEEYFPSPDGSCQIHELNDREDLTKVIAEARERGLEKVVAAGGDGTISAVANGLIGSEVPLGIIPLGTANVLARELEVPLDLHEACRLVAGAHAVTSLDAMRAGARIYFTQVGIGIDALMIRDTTTELKRRFGRLAYVWTALIALAGFQPRRFSIAVDDKHSRPRASQVVIANCGILGQKPFRWGPDIRPDDGRLDVCIVRARSLLDYVSLFWHVLVGHPGRHRNMRYLSAVRSVAVTTDSPLPVQADGETIGQTPVQVSLVPGAVQVIVPAHHAQTESSDPHVPWRLPS